MTAITADSTLTGEAQSQPGAGASTRAHALVFALIPDAIIGLGSAVCAGAGMLSWTVVATFVLLATLTNALYVTQFLYRVRHPFSLETIAMWRIAIGLLPFLYVLFHMKHVDGRLALAVIGLVPVVFSVLVLDRRRMLMMAFLLSSGFSATLAAAHRFHLGAALSSAELLLIYVLYTVTLALCFVGDFIYQIRLRARTKTQQLKLATQQLAALARQDELTGLTNRSAILQVLAQALARRLRDELPLTVILFDLDHFKQINDSLGHASGDEVLRRVAAGLTTAMRSVDVLGRYGGEEFLAVLPQTDLDGALIQAERMRRALHAIDVTDLGPGLRLTASFGLATHHLWQSSDALLAQADAAMYQAKALGRDRVHVQPQRAAAATLV